MTNLKGRFNGAGLVQDGVFGAARIAGRVATNFVAAMAVIGALAVNNPAQANTLMSRATEASFEVLPSTGTKPYATAHMEEQVTAAPTLKR